MTPGQSTWLLMAIPAFIAYYVIKFWTGYFQQINDMSHF